MKAIGSKFYAKVDVHQYYSFMVVSDVDMSDDDVINESLKNDLFEDNDDCDYAEVDNLIDEYDLRSFERCNCVHKI